MRFDVPWRVSFKRSDVTRGAGSPAAPRRRREVRLSHTRDAALYPKVPCSKEFQDVWGAVTWPAMNPQDNDGGAAAFDKLAALLDYPMFVVTTVADGHRSGCLVGFTSQTSINPPRFLVGISRKNHTYTVAKDAEHLAVHVLPRGEKALATLFGEKTGDDTDKFDECAWQSGPEGLPILDAAAAWFVGKIIGRFDLGDHVGHLIEPVAGSAPDTIGELITFSDVHDLEPGHDA